LEVDARGMAASRGDLLTMAGAIAMSRDGATGSGEELRDAPPKNLEAEMALLGAILVNNAAFHRVSEFLRPEHFAEPVHGRIYEAIGKLVERGQVANPVTLKNIFDQDSALREIGGAQYLARLVVSVVTILNTPDYAASIVDSYRRREMIKLGEAISDRARNFELDSSLEADARQFAERLTSAAAAPTGTELKTIDDYRDDTLELYHHGRERAYATGWRSVDALMKIRRGELSVVTGIPNHGKSEFVDALTVNLAMLHGWRFALCSFENPPAEHIAKIAEKYLALPFWEGPSMRMSERELARAMDWAKSHFFFIRAENSAPTLDWILAEAANAHARHKIDGLSIDPHNEIEHHRPSNQTETEYVSHGLGKVKRFAQRFGVHVWYVAHPAKMPREGETIPPPTLYDISGSANWANKADVGLVVYRDPDATSPMTCIYTRKVRFKAVGKVGVARLRYDVRTGRYLDPLAEATNG